MVQINMNITHHVDKLSRFQTTNVSHHMGEKGVADNVEGDAKADVAGTLIH